MLLFWVLFYFYLLIVVFSFDLFVTFLFVDCYILLKLLFVLTIRTQVYVITQNRPKNLLMDIVYWLFCFSLHFIYCLFCFFLLIVIFSSDWLFIVGWISCDRRDAVRSRSIGSPGDGGVSGLPWWSVIGVRLPLRS